MGYFIENYSDGVTVNISVSDNTLFRVNFTVFNSTGSQLFNRYLANLTGNTSYNILESVNFILSARSILVPSKPVSKLISKGG